MIVDISDAQLASNHYVRPPLAIELQFEPDAFLCKIVAALGRKVTSETPSFCGGRVSVSRFQEVR